MNAADLLPECGRDGRQDSNKEDGKWMGYGFRVQGLSIEIRERERERSTFQLTKGK